jgi:MFS family permease
MPPADASRSRLGLVVAVGLFAALGMPDGGMGVLWPAMRRTLAAPLDALGILTAALTAGAFAGSVASGHLARRTGWARLLLGGVMLSAAALLGVAGSPTWATVVVGFLAMGCAGGTIERPCRVTWPAGTGCAAWVPSMPAMASARRSDRWWRRGCWLRQPGGGRSSPSPAASTCGSPPAWWRRGPRGAPDAARLVWPSPRLRPTR